MPRDALENIFRDANAKVAGLPDGRGGVIRPFTLAFVAKPTDVVVTLAVKTNTLTINLDAFEKWFPDDGHRRFVALWLIAREQWWFGRGMDHEYDLSKVDWPATAAAIRAGYESAMNKAGANS